MVYTDLLSSSKRLKFISFLPYPTNFREQYVLGISNNCINWGGGEEYLSFVSWINFGLHEFFLSTLVVKVHIFD